MTNDGKCVQAPHGLENLMNLMNLMNLGGISSRRQLELRHHEEATRQQDNMRSLHGSLQQLNTKKLQQAAAVASDFDFDLPEQPAC